jgi:hypothetical protein
MVLLRFIRVANPRNSYDQILNSLLHELQQSETAFARENGAIGHGIMRSDGPRPALNAYFSALNRFSKFILDGIEPSEHPELNLSSRDRTPPRPTAPYSEGIQ